MKWIIYDAWGVIYTVGDDVQQLLLPFLHDRGVDITAEQLAQAYAPARRGEIDPREFWRRIGLAERYSTIEHEYLQSRPEIDPGFRPVAERLAQNHHLALLSNDVGPWSAALRQRFGLGELFDQAIVSAEVGLSKPDPAMYEHVLRRLGAAGADCVFIDDRPRNLHPARQAGIRTILFARDGAAGGDDFDAVVADHDELPQAVARALEA